MPSELRVFLNEQPLTLPAGATVGDALRRGLPELSPLVAEGAAHVTDGRGIEVDLASPLAGGAILRAQRTSRRG